MTRKWIIAQMVVALAAVATAGCGERIASPPVPATLPMADLRSTGFTKLQAPSHAAIDVSVVIDSRGGFLQAPTAAGRPYGYMLVVPPRTVTKATTFTLHVVGGRAYEVDLTAVQDGRNVGKELKQPVALGISFQDSPDGLPPGFARRLRIYYLPEVGAPQAMPTFVAAEQGFIMATLPHFSRYAAGLD